MYNPGFGDCFLLAFPADEGAFYMLIDFGVHHQYPNQDQRIPLVAEDIARATGKHLHAVVITHEHTDHLYGFKHGKKIFDDEFAIDELWLAWTEDPDNKLAQELKKTYGLHVRALAAAIDRLRATDDPFAEALQGVLGFEVPEAMAATDQESAELQYLRTKAARVPRKQDDYHRPGGAPRTLAGVKDVQLYVLGPPENLEAIKSLVRKSELYAEEKAMDEDTAFAAAVFAAGADSVSEEDQMLFDRSQPFDASHRISINDISGHPTYEAFFREHYGFADNKAHGPRWRRIETDWLGASEQLALKIDKKTNNTSLALAIELTQTKPHKVLLFAADAQVGNWLSWHNLSWPGESDEDERVKVKDLLGRTVLYKVGHHGSHNATLKEKGLEMMNSPDLVAMLPVDQEWANKEQKWEHPAKRLYQRLVERTKGRVIRSDGIPKKNQPFARPAKAKATEDEWQAFVEQLDWDRSQHRLWIEYTVPG